MRTSKVIKNHWGEYDKNVARMLLANYGVIFLDSLGDPIDNEDVWEDLYKEYKNIKK